jgi:uncharacterized membrane protein
MFLSLTGVFSSALCYYGYRRFGKDQDYGQAEGLAKKIYPVSSLFYLTVFLWLAVDPAWLTPTLSAELLCVFLAGYLFDDALIRISSLVLLVMAAVRFAFVDQYLIYGPWLRWSLAGITGLIPFGLYFLYKSAKDRFTLGEFELSAPVMVFVIAFLLLITSIFKYMAGPWISVALGISGLAFFVLGFACKDKIFRQGGFAVFALILLRVFFVDLSGLAIVYKIVSFIILGLLFLAVSFIYTRYNLSQKKE